MTVRRALLAIAVLALAVPASASAYSVTPISATQGAAISADTVVSSFNDGTNVIITPCNMASVYHATIDWGDGGGPVAATVTGPINPTPLGPCHYAIKGGHTYTATGQFTLKVSVPEGPPPGSGTGTATVAPAPLTALTPVSISATAGQPLDAVIGGFSDAWTGAPVGDFAATVDWGDGTPATAGQVTATSLQGTFVVAGTHTYGSAGSRPISIAVSAQGGGATTLSATATVVPGPKAPPPPGPPTSFKLSLGSIVRRKQRAFSLNIGCPKREASCRGNVALYWLRGSGKHKLGSKLFLLAGGTKATIDVVIGSRDARAIGRSRSVTVRAEAIALNPSANRAAAQSKTTRIRIR
jgi:hypothetical protein